jgi:hypothetical protein
MRAIIETKELIRVLTAIQIMKWTEITVLFDKKEEIALLHIDERSRRIGAVAIKASVEKEGVWLLSQESIKIMLMVAKQNTAHIVALYAQGEYLSLAIKNDNCVSLKNEVKHENCEN